MQWAANLDAIEQAAARGVKIAIATGRSFHFALQALGELPDSITLIVHNGAIARSRTGETLLRRLLPQLVALQVLEATSAWRSEATAIIQAVERLEDAIVEDPVQISFNGGVDQMRAVAAHLAAHPVAPDLEVLLAEYPGSDFSMVDVCAAGTTKGSGLATLAKSFGVAQDEVMAVGDNHNDLAMLRWAGTGVIMGNAEPELFEAGFHRTTTNDECGLARAIEHFVVNA